MQGSIGDDARRVDGDRARCRDQRAPWVAGIAPSAPSPVGLDRVAASRDDAPPTTPEGRRQAPPATGQNESIAVLSVVRAHHGRPSPCIGGAEPTMSAGLPWTAGPSAGDLLLCRWSTPRRAGEPGLELGVGRLRRHRLAQYRAM